MRAVKAFFPFTPINTVKFIYPQINICLTNSLTTGMGYTMTEAMEQETQMDMNGILLFSEQDGLMLDKIERLEKKLERLERTLCKLGKVVIRHVSEEKKVMEVEAE